MNYRPLLLATLALAACQQEPAQTQASHDPALPGAVPPPMQAEQPQPPAPPQPTPAQEQASDDWRQYAKPKDADRLKRLDAAWAIALEGAHAAQDPNAQKELAALGALVDPKARVLPNPHPAPGVYRCRTIKMGGISGFISYPWFRCRVELTPGGDLTFEKLTGSQRGKGKFYPYTDTRLAYLGGQAWGLDEKEASAYGAIPERDQVGVLERVGEAHWRLVLPWPRVESDLDIVEISR